MLFFRTIRLLPEQLEQATTYRRYFLRSRAETREAHLASIVYRHRWEITRIANRRERMNERVDERASKGERGREGRRIASRRYISYAAGER